MTLIELAMAGMGFVVGATTIGTISAKWHYDTAKMVRRQLMKVSYYLSVQDYNEAKMVIRATVEGLQ